MITRVFAVLTFQAILALLLTSVAGFAQVGPSFKSNVPKLPDMIPQNAWLSENKAKDTQMLESGVIQDVYIAVGYVVYLSFPKEIPIENVYVGATNMITADVSPETNAIALNAHVMSGTTNLTVVLRGKPYSFTVHIVSSGDIKYTLAYTLPTLAPNDEDIKYNFGPPLAPQSIQVQKYVQAIENRHLKYKTPLQMEMGSYTLNKFYTWGNCSILLDTAYSFPSDNMVVLKLYRKNAGSTGVYLSARQIGVKIANNSFPPTLSMQMSEVLFPGQSEYIYLFLQGFNLIAKNNFELSLPPSPENVNKLKY